MQPHKKISVDSSRSYVDLSPADLVEFLTLEPTVIDQAEFARVEWFWNRRPKVLLENLIVLFGYVIVFVCLLYRIPEDLPALLFWTVAGASWAFVEWFRLDRWGNEYESSIKRLLLRS